MNRAVARRRVSAAFASVGRTPWPLLPALSRKAMQTSRRDIDKKGRRLGRPSSRTNDEVHWPLEFAGPMLPGCVPDPDMGAPDVFESTLPVIRLICAGVIP